VAQVECSFELYCTAAAPPRQPFPLIFPVTRADDPAIEVTDLTVWIDSVEIKDVVYSADMRFPPYDWSYRGYRFSGEVETQRTMHVQVNYTMPLAMTRSEAFFRYVLRSGGTWSAPILKETVIVHAGRGLAVHPLSAKTLKPIIGGGTITWMLRNSRPAEDIELWVRAL
jgi:hypothetical protein